MSPVFSMFEPRARWRRCGGLIALVALLAACASPPAAVAPEQSVRDRANLRWKALLDADVKGAYELTPPSYRALTDLRGYRTRYGSGGGWVAAEAVRVDCEPQKCNATIRIRYRPLLGQRIGDTMTTHVVETWVQEEGQWWFFPRP